MAFSFGKVTTSTELAQAAHAKDKEKTLEEMIPPYLHDLLPAFDKGTASRLPMHTEYDHEIKLKPGFESMKAQVYPLAPAQRTELEKFIQENESKGYIRPSKSPVASPFFFVGKKDGSYRPCQDYRTLNANTIKDRYPLPLITDLMEKMKGARYFTKMDLRAGYNNVRIKEGDEWKAAFIVPGTDHGPPRLYEPTVMFFGLCNSPATFQRMMNTIFADMMQEGWMVIYMDDILIFSADLKEHQQRTRRVIERLREHDLYLKPEKCYFDVTEVEFLGLILRPNAIAMDPVKVEGVTGWKPPTCLKETRSFLGFANFYRRFISHFSERARPLVDLTKKDVRWHWDNEQQKAFEDIKAEFTRAPVLLMPQDGKPFSLETDASKFATGGVLRQQDENGDWHPCGFISQSLNPAERNYEIYDRELLAIIRGLEAWRHLLLGAPHPIQILCDHKNLGYWRTAQKLNRRQARWALFLSEFDYELIHVPGTKMVQSDALSRRSDHDPGDNDNEDMLVLPDARFARNLSVYRTMMTETFEEDTVLTVDDPSYVRTVNLELRERIRDCHIREPIVRDAITALYDKGPAPARTALTDWMEDGELVYYRGKAYVPPNKDLRRDVVKLYHDLPSAGHPGIAKTTTAVQRDFWWPGMAAFISRYVKGCAACQQMKPNTHPTTVPIIPIPAQLPAVPWSCTTIDWITDLPPSGREKFDSICVMVDHDCTKGVIFAPGFKTTDALGTARIIHDSVYRRFGMPDKIISDRGPQFASHVMQEALRLGGVEQRMSTAYHPQTDGQTERANQSLEVFLRIFCANNPDKWSEMLTDAEFAHNSREHSTIKMSPFYAMMGYNPRAFPHVTEISKAPATAERISEIARNREEAAAAMEQAQKVVERRVKQRTPAFRKDQEVWLESTNLRLPYPTRKLAPKREGPFRITKVMGPVTYELKLPDSWRIHPVFHAGLLSPYTNTDEHGENYTRPPPDEIEGEDNYEVESILGHRRKANGTTEYRILWKGYSTADSTWEPERNIIGTADELLTEYKRSKKLPLKPSSKRPSRK